MQAAFTSEQLMADLKDERDRAERLRAVRDDALMQRWVGVGVGVGVSPTRCGSALMLSALHCNSPLRCENHAAGHS
jgi:hypothetical protein